MSATSSIEWTATVHPDGSMTPGKTWNPVRGCSVISPGCVNCYAMKQAHRFSGDGKPYAGLTKQTKAGPQWTGIVRTVDSAVLEPLSWRQPARVFVNSMSDLFHEDVPDAFIDQVFAVMALAPRHTFQILTKRAERMRAYFADQAQRLAAIAYQLGSLASHRGPDRRLVFFSPVVAEQWTAGKCWPLPNVWLGVSVEDQPRLEERISHLVQTPAAIRFLSCEPLIGPIDFASVGGLGPLRAGWSPAVPGIDWVIVGGESGPGARDLGVRWVREIVRHCRASAVPVFVKQLGARVIDRNDAGFLGEEQDHWPEVIDIEDRIEHDLDGTRDGYQGAPVRIHLRDSKGGDMAEWPADLRVREFPR